MASQSSETKSVLAAVADLKAYVASAKEVSLALLAAGVKDEGLDELGKLAVEAEELLEEALGPVLLRSRGLDHLRLYDHEKAVLFVAAEVSEDIKDYLARRSLSLTRTYH